MTTSINNKEYLKKYLSVGKAPGEKKKKKKKPKGLSTGLKIVDDDVLVNISEEIQQDLEGDIEDAPQIVSVIDDRPPSMRVEDDSRTKLWKPIGSVDDNENTEKALRLEGGFKLGQTKLSKSSFKNSSSNKKSSKSKNSDFSPPKMRVKQERRSPSVDSSPPRPKKLSKNRDISPPRKIKEEVLSGSENEDDSPPRSRNTGEIKKEPFLPSDNRDRDFSPPRRDQTEDMSPPRNTKKDSSPPRKRKEGISPTRRNRSEDMSPPRNSKRDKSEDHSPPRRSKSDILPPRRSRRDRSEDISPPRRNKKSPYKRDNEISPHRRKRNHKSEDNSPARRHSSKRSEDISPPRKRDRETSPVRVKKSRWGSESEKMTKTLEGKTAGLQNALDLAKETAEIKHKNDEIFRNLSSEASGKNAATVVRNSMRKKEKQIDPEEEERKRIREEQNKEKYDRWGKGLKQVEAQNLRMADMAHEMNKPLARYADDQDLEEYLKEQDREGDPMLAYMRKKKKKAHIQSGGSIKPRYEGEFPANRFGIPPGYRWDGVNRSNGYEKKYFEVQNKRKADIEEAYKWSTEDM